MAKVFCGIERCPVRTVAIFSRSSCDIIAADRRGLSTKLQPKKRVTRLLVPGLALPHGRQGCVGLGIACQVSTRDFGPGELAGRA